MKAFYLFASSALSDISRYLPFSSCKTCRLDYFSCPGHFGHVELAVPVYHPLLFKHLFNLLRSTCFYCHAFRLKDVKVKRYVARILLARVGLVKESIELESIDLLESSDEAIEASKTDSTAVLSLISKILLSNG